MSVVHEAHDPLLARNVAADLLPLRRSDEEATVSLRTFRGVCYSREQPSSKNLNLLADSEGIRLSRKDYCYE